MFFAAIFLLGLCLTNAVNFTTVYQWDKFDFIWPSNANSSNSEQIRNKYRTEQVHLEFMAVFGERLFLSIEMFPGIPASMAWLPTSGTSTASPKLAPFPSLDLYKKDNCETIQWTKGIVVDTDGRLWMLDRGSSKCPSKIWIFNLLNNDTTERVHHFPDSVVSHSSKKRALRDIVLDKTADDYLAYITNSESECIVVYSGKCDKSWSVKTPGRKWYSMALSLNREAGQLFLGRDGSYELYSVSASELKNGGGSAGVKLIGDWTEKPYKMLIDSANVLYAAFFGKNFLSKWNISEPFREQRFHEAKGLDRAGWPFILSLDTTNTLWMMQRNESEGLAKTRHKLLKAAVGARSPKALTPTSKNGTRQPALESNETGGGFTDLAEDYRKSQSLNTILIFLLVCCLVLYGTIIAWLSLRMRRMQTCLRQASMDNNRAEMSVFLEDPIYDEIAGPENSNTPSGEARPENPEESFYTEVDPEPLTPAHYNYAFARTPFPELYEEPLRLGNVTVGNPSEPENIYDDVGPEPSAGPSTESEQYLEVLPSSGETRL